MKISKIIGASRNARRFSINEKTPSGKKSSSGTARDPKANKVKIAFPKVGDGAAGQFEESPIDLTNIENAYYTDSYISRAVDKTSGLMFKSGWELTSKNNDALDYVNTRLKLIEEATELSTEELFKELGHNFILYGNAPVIKVRGSDNLGGLNATGYYGGDPIAGLFPAPPSKFQIMRDENGNIENYEVEASSGGTNPQFKVEDVFFYTYQKPSGRGYGVPYYQNVLDDVLILRQIEENVARLVHKNLFPLQTYTVGQNKDGWEATDEEIVEVQEMVDGMPLDGILVIPERHKVESVTSSNDSLNASEYLKYFRQRVFTGLAMSESTMGVGDTANRSTSDNQSSDLVDLVKNFQQAFKAQLQRTLINEILFEGGYDPTLNKEDEVSFQFNEIDSSALIKRENSVAQLYAQNLINIDEARIKLGLEPTDDFSKFNFQLVKETNNSDGTVENNNQPENQHGKLDGPTKEKSYRTPLTESSKLVNLDIDTEINKNFEMLKYNFSILESDITERMNNSGNNKISEIFNLTIKLMERNLTEKVISISRSYIQTKNHDTLKVYSHLRVDSKNLIPKLMRELEFKLENKSDDISIADVFDSMNRRLKMIATEEVKKGINYNYCLKEIDKKNYIVTINNESDNCSDCKEHSVVNLQDKDWHLKIPPYHPYCNCDIK